MVFFHSLPKLCQIPATVHWTSSNGMFVSTYDFILWKTGNERQSSPIIKAYKSAKFVRQNLIFAGETTEFSIKGNLVPPPASGDEIGRKVFGSYVYIYTFVIHSKAYQTVSYRKEGDHCILLRIPRLWRKEIRYTNLARCKHLLYSPLKTLSSWVLQEMDWGVVIFPNDIDRAE